MRICCGKVGSGGSLCWLAVVVVCSGRCCGFRGGCSPCLVGGVRFPLVVLYVRHGCRRRRGSGRFFFLQVIGLVRVCWCVLGVSRLCCIQLPACLFVV
jgi:hypothetical protein